MQVRHPEALEGVGGDCPDRVTLGGASYDCSDGATFEAPRGQAEALAERYGVDVADIAADADGLNQQTDDADADVLVKDDADICGTEMSDGTICERPADECPYHE